METKIAVDIVAYGGPTYRQIPVVNVESPASNVMIDADQLLRLLQFPGLYIYEAGTRNIITGDTFYDYFPSGSGGGGGGGPVDAYTKAETDALLLDKENVINKVNAITEETAADEYMYPSNKAVVDYVAEHTSGGVAIDDENISTDTTWSSNKINTEIQAVAETVPTIVKLTLSEWITTDPVPGVIYVVTDGDKS